MSEQRYVLVPVEPTQDMVDSVASTMDDAISGKEQTDVAVKADWAEMLRAAPPPPESVLSDEEIQSMWCQVATYDTHLADVIAISRSVERAVLQRLQGENREQPTNG